MKKMIFVLFAMIVLCDCEKSLVSEKKPSEKIDNLG